MSASLVRNSGLGVVAGLSSSLAGLVSGVIVARLLGVSGSGSVAMALWIVATVVMLCEFGLGGSLARFLPETGVNSSERRGVLGTVVRSYMGAVALGITLLVLGLWIYWPSIISNHATSPGQAQVYAGLIVFCFLGHMGYALAYHYMRGMGQFSSIAIRSILGAGAQVLCVAIGGVVFGINGAFAGYLIGSLPMAIVVLSLLPRGRLDAPARKRLRRYAGTLWIATLFSPIVWTKFDLIMVDLLLNVEAVGLFSVAATLAALLAQLCTMVSSAVLPHLATVPQEDRRLTCSRIAKGVLALLIPATLGAAAIAPALIPLVYGSDFARAGLIAALLSIGAVGSVITMLLANILHMLERNDQLIIAGIIGAIATVGLDILLIPDFGLVGAAVARMGAQGLIAGLTIWQVNRLQPGTIAFRWLTGIVVASLLCAGTAALLLQALGGALGIVAAILAGVLIYAISARFLIPLDFVERTALAHYFGRAAFILPKGTT